MARFAAFILCMMLWVVCLAHGGLAGGAGGGHGGGHSGASHIASGGHHGTHGGASRFHGGGHSQLYIWHVAPGGQTGSGSHGGLRGGYYGHSWCWGLGIWLPLLPWYSGAYWSGGMPYYAVDNLYYVWDADAGAYQAVEPPADLSPTPPEGTTASSSDPEVSAELYVYPRAGQSPAQQQQDEAECRHWAEAQTGFDPSGTIPTPWTTLRAYLWADAACLQARYYSVR
jgi:hypothetical protein